MYEFQWHSSFIRAYNKLAKTNPLIINKAIHTLELIQNNPFDPHLKTHKLHGELKDLFSASIDYEYRMIFSIFNSDVTQSIVLIDIGTHEEVY